MKSEKGDGWRGEKEVKGIIQGDGWEKGGPLGMSGDG